MVDNDRRAALARLEGILDAFEWFNDKTNHVCTFEVYEIEKERDVAGALGMHFKLPASRFEVTALGDWEPEVRALFAKYLFLFADPRGHHLVDPQRDFPIMDEDGRRVVLDDLANLLRSLGVTAGWRIEASHDCAELREWCFRDDLVLELPDRYCLLHLGVSD